MSGVGDNIQKPVFWALDPAAVDPKWEHFWRDCVACVPCWDTYPIANSAAQAGVQTWGYQVISPRYGFNRTLLTTWGNGASFPVAAPNITEWGSSISVGQAGIGVTYDMLLSAQGGLDVIPTTNVTILLVRKKSATAIADLNGFGLNATNGTTGQCDALNPNSDGIVYWDYGGSTLGTSRVTWGGYTPAARNERWAFVAGPEQGMAIYFEGDQKASQASTGTHVKGNTNLGIFAGQTNLLNHEAEHKLFFAVLDAEWTQAQIREWSEDPFGPITMADVPLTSPSRNPTKFMLRR